MQSLAAAAVVVVVVAAANQTFIMQNDLVAMVGVCLSTACGISYKYVYHTNQCVLCFSPSFFLLLLLLLLFLICGAKITFFPLQCGQMSIDNYFSVCFVIFSYKMCLCECTSLLAMPILQESKLGMNLFLCISFYFFLHLSKSNKRL